MLTLQVFMLSRASSPDPRQDQVLALDPENRVLLENYYLPGVLGGQIGAFVDHDNNRRYHESRGNVTPADTYFVHDTAIIERRNKIKKLTLQNRRLNHQRQAA